MVNIEDNLNIRFNVVIKSKEDRDFYMALYQYFDYIYKSPRLEEILNVSEKEYSEAFHGDIWEDHKRRDYSEEELDERSSQVNKLERFNLYAMGCTILVRIYLPIDDYRNSKESDRDQDPVALLLLRGFDYTLSLKKWSRDYLKRYNRWFEGKRDQYESQLRHFHLMLLDEVSKPKTTKPTINFDKAKSILDIGEAEVSISLKNDKTNAHYVLEFIFENEEGLKEKSFYTDIIESKFANEKMEWRSIYRACNGINRKVSDQVSLSNFLIIKTGKSGYTQINPEYL